jgi:PEP-CTERM motif-containing protein
MRYRQHWLVAIAVAVVGLASACSALAVSVNPYSVPLADIQTLADNTSGFSGGLQLSTIDAIHTLSNGISLDVTWRVGQNTDSFSPNYGETFGRVVLGKYMNNEDSGQGRLIFPGNDGIKWNISSDTPLSSQPYIQTAPSFVYYQPPSTIAIPGTSTTTTSTLSFDNANNFNGILPNTIVHQDANGQIRADALGLQFYPSIALTPGTPVTGHITLTASVPEPTSVMLLFAGVAGIAAKFRRRRG